MGKCNWVDFGLFGPGLTYHTNKYDNNRLVISLIFCKLFINLGLNCHYNKYESYSVYGFYFDSDPSKLTIRWGNYCKVVFMPWTYKTVERYVLDNEDHIHDGPFYNDEDLKLTVEDNPNEVFTTNFSYPIHSYYKVLLVERPRVFRRLDWFDKQVYRIYVQFAKDYYGVREFSFDTEHNICVERQIEVQILMLNKEYTDF